MKKLVDTNDPLWRKTRSEQWERYYGDGYRSRNPKLPDWIVNEMKAHKAVYMGDASSLSDPVIAQDGGDPLCDSVDPCGWFASAFFLNPHQCEENWLWMIEEGWRHWVTDKELPRSALFFALFSGIGNPNWDIIRDWGGDSALFFQFFRLLAGSEYNAESYMFNGEFIGKHPLDPREVLKLFITHVRCVVVGDSPFEMVFAKEYDFAIQAFEYVNPEIFEPESKVKHPQERWLKRAFADSLHTIHRRERVFLELTEKGKLTDYWRDRTLEEWRQSPEINDLIQRLEDDMTNGRFPASVGRLYHWAAAEAANTNQLQNSSLYAAIDYIDPWTVEVPKVNIVDNGPKKRKKPKAIVLGEEVEQHVCNELEKYRLLAIAGGMKGFDTPFDRFKSYLSWRKAKTVIARNKRAVFFNDVYENRGDYPENLFISYVEELFPKNITQIFLDVFGVEQEGDVNREYRNAWKALSTMVGEHVTINSIRTRMNKNPKSAYDIAVTVVTDRQRHVFKYDVASDWLDESIFSDFNIFAEAEDLPWRFRWDDGDNMKTVVYLPAVFDAFSVD